VGLARCLRKEAPSLVLKDAPFKKQGLEFRTGPFELPPQGKFERVEERWMSRLSLLELEMLTSNT